jgi:hypothetical protein
LDAIRDAVGTYRQWVQMCEMGLRPVAVLTEGEDYARMEEFCGVNERVCVAGGVASGSTYISTRYWRAWEASGGVARIHGLGYLRLPDAYRLPICSGDSHSFSNGAKYGIITMYDRHSGFSYVHRRSNGLQKGANWERARGLMRRCGIGMEKIRDPDSYHRPTGVAAFLNQVAYLRMQADAARLGFSGFVVIGNVTGAGNLNSVAATIRGWTAAPADRYSEYVRAYERLNELSKRPDALVSELADAFRVGINPEAV